MAASSHRLPEARHISLVKQRFWLEIIRALEMHAFVSSWQQSFSCLYSRRRPHSQLAKQNSIAAGSPVQRRSTANRPPADRLLRDRRTASDRPGQALATETRKLFCYRPPPAAPRRFRGGSSGPVSSSTGVELSTERHR